MSYNVIPAEKTEKLESENLNELFTALAKAQEEMEGAIKESVNPFFKSKYADLESVVKTSRPVLTKNGLSVIQRPVGNELRTRLGHASGQWIESRMDINPPKTDIHTLGSYLTYLRRYAYAAIVGVITTDDDGEHVMDRKGELERLFNALPAEKQQSFLNLGSIKSLQDLTEDRYKGAILNMKSLLKKETKKGAV